MSKLFEFLQKNELFDLPNNELAKIAGSITSKDIVSADVRTYFREQLLWYWSAPQSMAGAIQTAISSGSLPKELEVSLGEMWSSLFGQSASVLKTASDLVISQRIKDGIDALQALGTMSEKQNAGFYDLGDGLLFPGVTEEEIQQVKDDKEAKDAAEEEENARVESEMKLRQDWETALLDAGAEEAIQNGDKDALISSVNSAIIAMG